MLRTLSLLCLVASTLALGPSVANAQGSVQDFPSHPMRIIVPFAPGGSTDVMARMVAEGLATRLHQQAVVENKAGAGGNIGADLVAKAAPDGYTLVMGSIGTHATNSLIYPQMPYDTVKDFVPVTQVARVTLVLVVHPSLPVQSVKELIALVKSEPGKFNYASGGIGASQHLAAELFKYMTGTSMAHVPYKGSAGALSDLLGGRVTIMFADLPLVLAHIQQGKLRALAVGDAKRSPALPDVPTVAEAGVPNFEATAWYGLFAPAQTPAPIVAKLQSEVAAILKQPDVRKRMTELGATPIGSTPQEFQAFQAAEIKRWKEVVDSAKIRME
ncbi:MAG: tripartite tricarboxylate transporter substrate binding protein [Burkholderiales bacterium]|nr:tripartite tricarboxylate transporter substrate binding protein [Burkholderiales bacterium]